MKPQPLDLEVVEKEVFKWIVGEPAHELGEFFDFTIQEIKQHIKSACEFYLKYKNTPYTFIKENSRYKEKVVGDFWLGINNETQEPIWDLDEYNDWLFKLAFKEIFGKKR